MSMKINDNDKTMIKNLVNEVKSSLNINETINIEIKPMKQKIASFSFKTKTLRLNKYVVENFEKDLLYYIILHELIHFKVKSTNHNLAFENELKKHFSEEICYEIELKIIQKLI